MGEACGATVIKFEAKLTYYIILDIVHVVVEIKCVAKTTYYTNAGVAHVST